MNAKLKSIPTTLIALVAVCIMLTMSGCKSWNGAPSASASSPAATPDPSMVASISVANPAVVGTALSSAAADRLSGEVKKLETLLTGAGYNLTTSVDSCAGTPEERIICASDQLAALETAFAGVIKLVGEMRTAQQAALAEINSLRTQLGNAGQASVQPGSGTTSNTSSGSTSGSTGYTSGSYLWGSPWQCVVANAPGTIWDASVGDYYVEFKNKKYYGLSGVRYTWARKSDGSIQILNVNTMCPQCHPNGEFAHALCEAPPPAGNGNGTNNSGNQALAEARSRAEAEAEARAKVEVVIDIKPILVQMGVIGAATPAPTCTCIAVYDPVCVLHNGVIYTFPNSCVARCAGFGQYVNCANPLATATLPSGATAVPTAIINDPFCALFPNDPSCKTPVATVPPGVTPTVTPVGPQASATPVGPHPTGSPFPTQAATALPTTVPDCGATMVREAKFKQVRNIDWGDPFNWVILQVWNGSDPNTTMQVVVAPGHNIDLEAENLEGTAWIFKGTKEQVLCRAAEMAAEHGGIKLNLWVGPDPVPAGYEKPANQLGYTMSSWNYGPGGIVETPGTSWASEQLSLGKDTVCNNGDGVTLVQTWSPPDASIVTHVILEKGACVRPSKDIQGSVHHASGGNRGAVIARMHQMSTEVQSRDNPKTLHRLFIGCDPKPSGWKEDLSGWTVVNSPGC